MTAVPTQRKDAKDPFQLELHQAIALRKSRGLSIGISDSDENSENTKEEYLQKKDAVAVEKNDSDDEDDGYSDDYEDYSSNNNSDDELRKDFLKPSPVEESLCKQKNYETTFSQKSNDFIESTSLSNDNSSLSQTSSFPSLQTKSLGNSFNKLDASRADDEDDDDDDDPLSFLLQKNSTKTNKQQVKETDSFESSKSILSKKKVTFQPIASNLSPRSPTEHKLVSRQQTPYKSKRASNESSSILDDLLGDIKPRPGQRRLSSVEGESLRPQPKARRRHGSNASTLSEESQTKVSLQPSGLEQVEETQRIEDDIEQQSVHVEKTSFPTLEKKEINTINDKTKKTETEGPNAVEDAFTSSNQSLKISRASKEEHHLDSDMSSSTEDLLARMQAVSNDANSTTKLAKTPVKASDDLKQPVFASQNEMTLKETLDTPEESVYPELSITEDTFFVEGEHTESVKSSEVSLKHPLSARKSSARKSPRTPPVNYQGLGSLKGLKQLRTTESTDTTKLNSSANVRSAVYLQWLADREKKLKEKKKAQKEAEEKENEKKQKETEEKALEGESARRAWLKQKEGVLKEQAQKKKREERKVEREKIKQQEEKRASEKKAERVREKYLKEARIRHKEEMKKKKEEEKILRDQEEEKKKLNKEELNKWMEKRSKQWESDRKNEIRVKKKKERETKKEKEEKSKTAEDKYATWREAKEQREKETRRINRHDEARPPWSPANKVVPRMR